MTIKYFVENQIKNAQENERQKEIRSVAFKPECRFEKLFIVASVCWHFIIHDASAKKKLKLSNARDNCILE